MAGKKEKEEEGEEATVGWESQVGSKGKGREKKGESTTVKEIRFIEFAMKFESWIDLKSSPNQ